jgi:N-acetylmuramoyl-L-alanine amidase
MTAARVALAVFPAFVLGGLATATTGTASPERLAATIVIDPGHDRMANPGTERIGPGSETLKIKDGGGTHGVVSGIAEADLVLDVSLRLRALLVAAGARVVMTRTATAGRGMGNIARARIANREHAALFLRVHADGHTDSSVRGTHILVPAERAGWTDDVYAESRRAALAVLPELVTRLRFPNRGVTEHSDFTGFNWSDVPVVLVEMGFMTNIVEDRALARPVVRQRAAIGLCRGVQRYLGRPVAACGGAAGTAGKI